MLFQAAKRGDTKAVRFSPLPATISVCVLFKGFKLVPRATRSVRFAHVHSRRTVFRLVLGLNLREVNMSAGVYWEMALCSPMLHASDLPKTHKQLVRE